MAHLAVLKAVALLAATTVAASQACATDELGCLEASERLVSAQKELVRATGEADQICFGPAPKKLRDAIDKGRVLVTTQSQVVVAKCAKPPALVVQSKKGAT